MQNEIFNYIGIGNGLMTPFIVHWNGYVQLILNFNTITHRTYFLTKTCHLSNIFLK